jgi:tetratricopeptide (TPR) repeat protein
MFFEFKKISLAFSFRCFVAALTPVLVDDADTCRKSSGNITIAACTREIDSGTLTGNDLAFAYYHRGISYYDKGEYDLAIADYTKAIELEPEYPFTYRARARAYRAKGDNDRAQADFDKARSPP